MGRNRTGWRPCIDGKWQIRRELSVPCLRVYEMRTARPRAQSRDRQSGFRSAAKCVRNFVTFGWTTYAQ